MEQDWGSQIQAYGDELEYNHHFEDYVNGTWQEDVNGPDASYPGYQMSALDHSIIDDSFYPTAFRSGWDILPIPLSNWVNQYMPFDFSPENGGFTPVIDHVYAGLNYFLDQSSTYANFADMADAFATANVYGSSVYSFEMQSYENLAENITYLQTSLNTLVNEQNQYPGVTYKYVTATQAMQDALGLPSMAAPTFTVKQNSGTYVITSSQTLWGNSPYIALEYLGGKYTHATAEPVTPNTWTVTVPNLANCTEIGVAGSDMSGNPGVYVFSPTTPPNGTIPIAPPPPPSPLPEVPVYAVTASTYLNLTYNPGKAIDGTPSSSNYWGTDSVLGLPQWLMLDLWNQTEINQVTTHFYDVDSRTYTYNIQTSTDGSSWTTVVPTTAGSGIVVNTFAPVTARFVMITITGDTAYTAAHIEQINIDLQLQRQLQRQLQLRRLRQLQRQLQLRLANSNESNSKLPNCQLPTPTPLHCNSNVNTNCYSSYNGSSFACSCFNFHSETYYPAYFNAGIHLNTNPCSYSNTDNAANWRILRAAILRNHGNCSRCSSSRHIRFYAVETKPRFSSASTGILSLNEKLVRH